MQVLSAGFCPFVCFNRVSNPSSQERPHDQDFLLVFTRVLLSLINSVAHSRTFCRRVAGGRCGAEGDPSAETQSQERQRVSDRQSTHMQKLQQNQDLLHLSPCTQSTRCFRRHCRVWQGENVAVCVRFHRARAPLVLQQITRRSCSLERTSSTSPDNLLSKDTSWFSFVCTVKAVQKEGFDSWIFQEFETKHPFTSKRQKEINSGLWSPYKAH